MVEGSVCIDDCLVGRLVRMLLLLFGLEIIFFICIVEGEVWIVVCVFC